MVKITFSVDDETVRTLKYTSERLKKPQSMVVREAVAEYIVRHPPVSTPRSIGAFSSGRTDLSERAEERLAGMGRRAARQKRTVRDRR